MVAENVANAVEVLKGPDGVKDITAERVKAVTIDEITPGPLPPSTPTENFPAPEETTISKASSSATVSDPEVVPPPSRKRESGRLVAVPLQAPPKPRSVVPVPIAPSSHSNVEPTPRSPRAANTPSVPSKRRDSVIDLRDSIKEEKKEERKALALLRRELEGVKAPSSSS